MGPEAKIENEFVRWCDEQDLYACKLVLLNEKGFPDRTVLGRGKSPLFIEFKRPGGSTSPQQDWWIAKLRSAGYTVLVADNVADAQSETEEYFGL